MTGAGHGALGFGSDPDTGGPQVAVPEAPPVSVIVVSRGRPGALARCLAGLAQLDYPEFEVVVVSDPDGLSAIETVDRVKRVAFDEPNISAARNLGIAAAAGTICAFIDDDSVPLPDWLTHLVAPFGSSRVAATGGFVRGRNGYAWQWRGAEVDRAGTRYPRDVPQAGALLQPGPGRAIKTEGTNMAVRRDALADLGGFDPAYRFYLDETDLNLRLADRGFGTALVPRAEVHHGFAESDRRRADRVPLDLREIGASLAVLSRRHGVDGAALQERARDEQRRRLDRHLIAGRIEPRDMARLMRGFDLGWAAGLDRSLPSRPPLDPPSAAFLGWPKRFHGHEVLAGWRWQAGALRHAAARAVAQGRRVTVLVYHPGMARHRLLFRPEGWWESSGGLFGRARPGDPVWRPWRLHARIARERAAAPSAGAVFD